MRYIVAIAAAFLVLLFLGATTGFGDWPRPWGPISRGAVGGAIAIGVLIVWEQLYPREDSLTAEEKASLRDEETTAAEAEVTPDIGPAEVDPAAEAESPSEADPAAGAGSSADVEPSALPDEDGPSAADDGPRS